MVVADPHRIAQINPAADIRKPGSAPPADQRLLAASAKASANDVETSRLTVLTDDPITRLALVSYTHQHPHLVLVRQGAPTDLVIATAVDPGAADLAKLKQQTGPDALILLIVEGEWDADLHKALDAGVRAVLFRTDFTWERLNESVRQVRAGHGDLPTVLQGRLMDQVRHTQREVLTPRGLTPGGLTQREADVLKLVAEGYELQDIGSKLGYSERTIKNVLYGVIKRHQLRNRAHAVAYAVRCGLI